eukprot:1159699-Pelagomonas_calceolata.AAC.6
MLRVQMHEGADLCMLRRVGRALVFFADVIIPERAPDQGELVVHQTQPGLVHCRHDKTTDQPIIGKEGPAAIFVENKGSMVAALVL